MAENRLIRASAISSACYLGESSDSLQSGAVQEISFGTLSLVLQQSNSQGCIWSVGSEAGRGAAGLCLSTGGGCAEEEECVNLMLSS